MDMTLREALVQIGAVLGLAFLVTGLFLIFHVNSSPLSPLVPEVTQMFTRLSVGMILVGATMVICAIRSTRNSN